MQGMETSFSLLGMLSSMNWVAKAVVLVLALMSIWSLTIAIERLWRFQRAKRESLEIALRVTPMLKQHKLEEAINLTSDKKYRHSHLARVLRAGLTEFQYETSQSLPEDFDLAKDSHLGLQIAESLVRALGGRFSLRDVFGWTVAEVKFMRQSSE